MASLHFISRGGKEQGPFSESQLKELAASGKLRPTDLIRHDGVEGRQAAGSVPGLFPAPAAPPLPTEPASAPPASAASGPPPGALGAEVSERMRRAQDRLKNLAPLVDRYSQEFAIEPRPLVAIAVGGLCLALVALACLLTWESYRDSYRMPIGGKGDPLGAYTSYAGITYMEGKLTCLLAVLGLAALGAAFVVKRWLPASLLIAGGAAGCAFLVAVSYDLKIGRYVEEQLREIRNLQTQMGKVSNEGKALMDAMDFQFHGGASFFLYVTILAALGAACAFAYAAVRKPLPLPFLQKHGAGPFLVQHGGLIGAYGMALLVGLVVYIFRY